MIDTTLVPENRIIHRGLHHLYLKPHPRLKNCIAHYTLTFPRPGNTQAKGIRTPKTLTLLPDVSGCIVFRLGQTPQGRFFGSTTSPIVMPQDLDDAPIRFFVEFLPGGAHQITGLFMGELTNLILPLAEVLPHTNYILSAILAEETQLDKILAQVDTHFLNLYLKGAPTRLSGLLPLLQKTEKPSVRALSYASGYSERHLSRLFQTALGVGVKTSARVFRVNRALKQMAPGINLTALAQKAGYFDQSHFIHDFKAICGTTPSGYLDAMSDFYKETYKF